MKKVIGLFAAGLLFAASYGNASTTSVESEAPMNDCVDFMSSCGQAGFYCGDLDTDSILAFDDYLCG